MLATPPRSGSHRLIFGAPTRHSMDSMDVFSRIFWFWGLGLGFSLVRSSPTGLNLAHLSTVTSGSLVQTSSKHLGRNATLTFLLRPLMIHSSPVALYSVYVDIGSESSP